MKRRIAPFVMASVLLAVACDDTREPLGPSSAPAAADISDGRFTGGNDDFFFLPPLMPDPRSETHYDAGGFNGNLGPTVTVCQLAANPVLQPGTDCALDSSSEPIVVASFTPSQVSVSADRYLVNWHTDESPLLVDRFYRLQVFLGAVRIGFADLDPVTSGRDLKNAVTGQTITLVDGRTLPIAFRIENGVLCTNKADCAEYRVTNEGGLFLTNTKDAAIQFKPGFLPEGVSEITLRIERVNVGPDNRCHGEASARLWVEFEGCYDITSDPDLRPYGGIQQPAIAGQCVEVSTADPLYPFLQPYKSHNGGELQRLASAPAPFLDCEGFKGTVNSSAAGGNPLLRFALAGLGRVGKGFGKVFGVRTLNAIDLGLGEELPIGTSLSRFNWAVGLEAEIAQGGEQEVGFGLQAPELLTVHVRSLHFHQGSTLDDVDDQHPEDVPGVPVRFTVTQGDGYFEIDEELGPVRTKDVLTGSNGRASVTFVAASNSADNVVTAQSPTLDEESEFATFLLSGLPPDLEVGALTRGVAAPTTADALSWSFDVTNVGAGAAIPSVARLVLSYNGEGTETIATHDFNVPRLAPGATASFSTPPRAGPHAAGGYGVIVMTNATGTVEEAGDENNTESEQFDVIEFLGRINGHVWSGPAGEQALPGTLLELLGPTGAVIAADTANDVTSIFRFLNLVPGNYSVRATHPDHQPLTLPATVTSGNSTVLEFELIGYTGELSGIVREASTQTPLANVSVEVIGTGKRALTSATGQYRLTRLPPGQQAVETSLPNFGTRVDSVLFGTGPEILDITLTSLVPYLNPTPAPPMVVPVTAGGSPVLRTVTIANGGGGSIQGLSMSFTYPTALVCDTCTPPRMVSVSLNTDVSPAVVTLTADADETIPAGDYAFVFTVSATNALNGPITYPFVVRVAAAPGFPVIGVGGEPGCGITVQCIPPTPF